MSAQSSDFESIKQISPNGIEYWSARVLVPLLGYDKWQNFDVVIQRAMTICTLTNLEFSEHFCVTSKVISAGFGAKREVKDYYLTRYALHLVLVCSDMRKPETVRALAYFTLASLDRNIDYYVTAKKLGVSIPNDIDITKEQRTIGQIRKAFQHLETIQQYKVAPYYVDLYFPDYRIAIECDEEGHRKYTQEVEFKRQNYIEQALGCTFVRYNPDTPNFNIGDVINQIIVLIYGLG
jgi:very-short-patch-repair endonuclease